MIYNAIKHILPEFRFEGQYRSVEELTSGNINNTYHLQYAKEGKIIHYTRNTSISLSSKSRIR